MIMDFIRDLAASLRRARTVELPKGKLLVICVAQCRRARSIACHVMIVNYLLDCKLSLFVHSYINTSLHFSLYKHLTI